jgi:hypothetical protein
VAADAARRTVSWKVLAAFVPLTAVMAACDGSKPPGQPVEGGGGGAPSPSVPRLGWSQSAASQAAVQGYTFILFVDGARTAFSGATCSGAGPISFECSGPLPPLTPGRRVLELSAADQGVEGPRSSQLAVDVGSDGRPRVPVLGEDVDSGLVVVDAPPIVPSTTCATEAPTSCFAVTAISTAVGPVLRLLPLPDGRLLVLGEDGAVTLLPSGTSERPEFARPGTNAVVQVADVAADPDFLVNRFLYFATTALAPDGRQTISIVRVRELADRVGEPATIVEGLPAGPAGNPVISVGLDRRLYLAIPSGSTDERLGYGGHVLRFTRDGAGAGDARTGSPILARGRATPARLVWDAASRLLIASGESGPAPTLSLVSVGGGEWPGAVTGIAGTAGFPETGLHDVAAAPPAGTPVTGVNVAMIGGNPEVLSLATLSLTNPPEIASKWGVPLGSLRPTRLAFTSTGDLIVAVAVRADGSGTILLRLRRI